MTKSSSLSWRPNLRGISWDPGSALSLSACVCELLTRKRLQKFISFLIVWVECQHQWPGKEECLLRLMRNPKCFANCRAEFILRRASQRHVCPALVKIWYVQVETSLLICYLSSWIFPSNSCLRLLRISAREVMWSKSNMRLVLFSCENNSWTYDSASVSEIGTWKCQLI
jgi:hypothetical protein